MANHICVALSGAAQGVSPPRCLDLRVLKLHAAAQSKRKHARVSSFFYLLDILEGRVIRAGCFNSVDPELVYEIICNDR